jgi:hypothetical protein
VEETSERTLSWREGVHLSWVRHTGIAHSQFIFAFYFCNLPFSVEYFVALLLAFYNHHHYLDTYSFIFIALHGRRPESHFLDKSCFLLFRSRIGKKVGALFLILARVCLGCPLQAITCIDGSHSLLVDFDGFTIFTREAQLRVASLLRFFPPSFLLSFES